MTVTKSSSFHPRIFSAGELKQRIVNLAATMHGSDAEVQLTIFEGLPDGTRHSRHRQGVDVLSTVCDLHKQGVSLNIDIGRRSHRPTFFLEGLSIILGAGDGEYLDVEFSAPTAEALNQLATEFPKALDLTPAPSRNERFAARLRQVEELGRDEAREEGRPTIRRAYDELADRVSKLESAPHVGRLSCFVSFQFDGPSAEYGAQVKRFLQLVGLNVVTGEGYEPRRISEKVKARLASSVDIVVVIEAANTKSSWTRDELSKAQQPGVYLIPLVEEGSTFDPGIFGDHEYISFPRGFISECFVPLLEGVRFVARDRLRAVDDPL